MNNFQYDISKLRDRDLKFGTGTKVGLGLGIGLGGIVAALTDIMSFSTG